jgi:hypothetical protein
MKRAEAMARDYARMAGYSDIRVIQISENVMVNRPMPMMRMAVAEAAADASTPIQPGQVGSSVTVNVTYEMMQ